MGTKIEWCDETWNPITGCSHSGSPGCDNCCAKRMATRLRGRFGYPQDDPFELTLQYDRLNQPWKWKKPRRIFMCSMSDLFHPDIPASWIQLIIDKMRKAPQHTYIILTKRPQNISATISQWLEILVKKYWLGVTAENQAAADERIPILLKIPAAVRFVSVEPMLGPIDLKNRIGWYKYSEHKEWQRGLDWVICGGETGPKARPISPAHVFELSLQAACSKIPFFFKGWGSHTTWECGTIDEKYSNRLLDGREWNEFPEITDD